MVLGFPPRRLPPGLTGRTVQRGVVASAAHRTEIMNTAAPDPGGVMRVHAEVPMSGFVRQPLPFRRSA